MSGINKVILVGKMIANPIEDGKECLLQMDVSPVAAEVLTVNVLVEGAPAESCFRFLQMGRQIYVEGSLLPFMKTDTATYVKAQNIVFL